MTQITMPQLSDSMEEGTILAWLKHDGEEIAAGEDLVEIETDKATITYESPAEGTLRTIAAEGDTLPVGALIASVGDASAEADRPAEPPPAAAAEGPATSSAPSRSNGGEVRATPLARRLAVRHEIDLASISGTGPRGRVTRTDVEVAAGVAVTAPPSPAPAPAAPAPAAPDDAKGEVSVSELSRLQQTVARRMSEAKATVPDFQVQTEVEMDAVLELRAQLKQLGGEVVPSINDLIVKAAALALRDHPRANGSFVDGRFETYSRINVGVAIAAQDALVVATISDADRRSLGSIAAEARRLAQRVRAGEVSPAELSGATFTVSNLGMYGMTAITPVINTPHAAILGVGTSRPLPALVDGTLVERQVMTLTLSCDHRILYGAEAAQFLSAIRCGLEQPSGLLL